MKAVGIIAVAFLLLCGVQAFAGTAYGQTDDVKRQAVSALNSKDYDKAVTLLERASSDDPFDVDLKRLLATAYQARGWEGASAGEFEAAFADFRKARLAEPEKQAITYLGLGYASFRLKDFDDALYYLSEAVGIEPAEGRAHQLIGEIYYQRGRLRDAIAEWEFALESEPGDQGLKERLARAKKELGVEGSFTKRETYYFNIKYEGEEKRELGDAVLDILDEAYSNVSGDLGFYPREPVTVILYTRKQFTDLTDAPSWSGGVYDGVIRIPVGGTNISREALAAVLHHEYAHAVIHMVAGRNVPTWLDEGIAQYEERWVRTPRAVLGGGDLIPLSSLAGSFMGIGDPVRAELAYSESLSAVEFFVGRYGMYSLAKLLRLMGEGKDISDAMYGSAGDTMEEFEGLWLGSFK